MTLPLDYPSILIQRVGDGEITYGQAFLWLKSHGVKTDKAKELLREASA